MSGYLPAAVVAAGLALATAGCDGGRDGAEVFTEACLTCHTLSEVGQRLAGRAGSQCVQYLERFLPQHHSPETGEREKVVVYLDAQLCRQR